MVHTNHHHHRHRRWLGTIIFSSILLGLIALAIGDVSPWISFWVLASVAVITTVLHYMLPGTGLFAAVFANSVGVYACLYVFFTSVNFTKASPLAAQVGFVLPLVAFLAGLLAQRRQILRTLEATDAPVRMDLLRGLTWILPLVAVGISTFLAPLEDMTQPEHDIALVGGMTVIALTVLLASRHVAVFLLDMGLLFEAFFSNAARLAKPAFAFLTWYSLLTIVFGCFFTIIDRFGATPHFVIGGVARPITFAEGLYVSVVTLSTVGYGDVVAATPAARLLIAAEIFTGVLLLLFGVEAVLSADRKRSE